MATSRTGWWSALFDTAPSSSDGLPIPGASGWRMVVQAATIAATNTTLTLGTYPPPSWQDITSHCVLIEQGTGDASDEGTNPVGQCRIVCTDDISALTGDPFDFTDNVNDRFGTQCYVRWGLYDTNGGGLGWLGQFAGIIDTVVEDFRPDQPRRTFELICFDLWYLIAGYRSPVDFGTSGTNVEAAVPALLDDLQYPFSAAWVLPGGAGNLVRADANQNGQTLMHQLAAATSAKWIAYPNGFLYLVDRDAYTDYRSTWYVLDGYVTGAGPTLPTRSAVVLPIAMRWVNSIDRLAFRTSWTAPYVVGTAVGVATSPVILSRKFLQRIDARAATVVTVSNDSGELAAQSDRAADRLDETTYLEYAEFDTQTAGRGGQPDLRPFVQFLAQTCRPLASYTVQRRLSPAGYVAPTVRVEQIDEVITMSPSTFRWQARHSYLRVSA